MLIAGVIVFCLILLVLAFLLPRTSHYVQRGGQAPMNAGGRTAHKAPGVGRWLAKPFQSASKMMGRSGSAGRRGRSKAPF